MSEETGLEYILARLKAATDKRLLRGYLWNSVEQCGCVMGVAIGAREDPEMQETLDERCSPWGAYGPKDLFGPWLALHEITDAEVEEIMRINDLIRRESPEARYLRVVATLEEIVEGRKVGA